MKLAVLLALVSATTLAAQDSGMTPLFDGNTLDGWTTKGGRYDGRAVWTVEDSVLTGREGPNHAGGLIYTARRYTSFDLRLDAWIDYPFDSGVFLNMVPREEGGKGLQVTLDYRPTGEVGGIYADGWLQHNKTAKALFKRNAWNRVRVRCTGSRPHVEVWLGDKKITDYTLPRDARGFASSGHIGLQVHGGQRDSATKRARFKNIRIRELPAFDRHDFSLGTDDRLKPRVKGWVDLLANGLDAWESQGGKLDRDYVFDAATKTLRFPKQGADGYLRTKTDFKDFELRLDFKIAFMANSGVFLRGSRKGGNPAYSGCEIQILDDFNWERVTKTKLAPYQFCGGLYGSVRAGHKALFEPGRWNSYRIRYVGSRIRVALNGVELYDVDTLDVPGKPPFAKRAPEGFIGLQRHAPAQVRDTVYAEFRNIFVRRLDS